MTLALRPPMKRDELLQRLKAIRDKGSRALRLLDSKPLTASTISKIQALTSDLKEELEAEYQRTLLKLAQKSMLIFELSVYCPIIEEAWTRSGIRCRKTDGPADAKWTEPIEAVVYTAQKYLS
jgi:hypothetical protein